MKNKFFGMLLMGMVAFSACNDDDDDKGGIPADFNGTYTNSSEEYVLDLKYSEVELLGKSVVFNSSDGATATLTLQGVVPGEAETVLQNVALTTADNETYTFSAASENDSRTVNVDGSIRSGLLSLDMAVAFAQNQLMGTWTLADPSVHFVWRPSTLAFQLDLAGNGEVQDIQVGLFEMFLPGMLSDMLVNYLQDVTFREDGNIVATYNAAVSTDENPNPEAVWQESPLNLAHYAADASVCTVYPNVEMIMRQVAADQAGRATASDPLANVLNQLLVSGVPVNYAMADGQLTMFIDEEFIKQFSDLIPLLGTILPSEGLPSFVPDVLEQLPGILEQTEQLEIGLILVPQE